MSKERADQIKNQNRILLTHQKKYRQKYLKFIATQINPNHNNNNNGH